MAVYFLTGKLGGGKSLCAVGKIRDYLREGRKVATNLNIYLDAMAPIESKTTIIRVPDKPTLWDLEALGQGCDEKDESRYGALVLDELATWFNCRNWNDKTRAPIIDWFLHSRKKHWDIYFIVQDIESIDKQLINALCEHLVICKRTDRLNIPFISSLLKFAEFSGKLPKFHIAKVYYGQDVTAMEVDRWYYRAHDLYPCYDTDQIFSEESDGLSTVLSNHYRNGFALIDYYKTQLKTLTSKVHGKQKRFVNADYYLAGFAIFVFAVYLGFRSYDKWINFQPKFFTTATAAPKPIDVKPELVQPVVAAKPPESKLSGFVPPPKYVESTRWRVVSLVKNQKTKEYLISIADQAGHVRSLPKGSCVFDNYNQPTCNVEGETVTLFTGSYIQQEKEKPKPEFFAKK